MIDVSEIRYVFFYPSEGIGGAQLLFARLADRLITKNHSVLVIEKNNHSFIHNYLTEKELQFESVKVSESKKYYLEKNDIVILSLSYIHLFNEFSKPKDTTRFVFWDLHPYALLETLAFSKIHKLYPNTGISKFSKILELNTIKKTKKFVESATDRSAIFFMSSKNFGLNKALFDINITPIYLPIPIENNQEKYNFDILENNTNSLNVVWISRLDMDKGKILELLINDVAEYNETHNHKITFHIIGEGNMKDYILKKGLKLGNNIRVVGKLYGEELDRYLSKNIGIGFSMGTAALEFAIRKIPTVLVPSTIELPLFEKLKERYMWLFNVVGYNLAVDSNHVDTAETFENIVLDYKSKKSQFWEEKSYQYVLDNHSFESIENRFLRYTRESDFTYQKLIDTGIFKKTLFDRVLLELKKLFKKLHRDRSSY